jgi:hypothetical protein
MANALYNSLGGGRNGQTRNFAPALLQHIQGYQGNPLEELQNKLNSGEMSQAQYNQLHSMAENIAQRMMSVLPHR